MPEEPQEPTYQHQVTADFVLEAITSLEWSDEQQKKFNKKGIYRRTIEELGKHASEFRKFIFFNNLNNEYKKNKDTFYRNWSYTILIDVEVIYSETLDFKDIQHQIPDIIIVKCK